MATQPSIGVVISTPGRASLYRTLRSVLYQGLQKDDDVLVIGDGFHQATKDLVDAFGPPFRYVATQVTRDWGHSQVNFGLKHVKGDVVIVQDDDDIFAPRAFEEIRRLYETSPGLPILGRVKTPSWGLLWHTPNNNTLLDGHCIVVPNDKTKLGYMSVEYYGDQCYIATCLDNYPEVNWTDRVWTLTRPEWKLFPKRAKLNHTLGPDHMQLYCDLIRRMPAAEYRAIEATDDWLWWFETAEGYLTGAVRMYEEDGHAHATIAFITGTPDVEIEEMVEFVAWAAQGVDCWFYTGGEERQDFIDALHRKKFEDHVVLPTKRDFVMEWPPSWFPSRVAVNITDERGVKVPDWRDKWGPDVQTG